MLFLVQLLSFILWWCDFNISQHDRWKHGTPFRFVLITLSGKTPVFHADMTGMLVEILKNNPYKLPIWVWHQHILTHKSYQRNARNKYSVVATCNRQRCSVCCAILMRTNRHSKSRVQRTKKGYKSNHDLSDTLGVTKIRNFNP